MTESALLQVAVTAARAAGGVATKSSPTDLVSEADLAA